MVDFKKRKDTGKPFPIDGDKPKGAVNPKDAKSNGSKKSGVDHAGAKALKEKKMKKVELKGFSNGKKEKEILIGVDANNQAVKLEVDLDRGHFAMSGTEFDLEEIYTEESGEKRAREMLQDQLDENPASYFPDYILQNHMTISDTDRRMIANEESDRATEDRDLDDLIEMANDYNVDFEEPEEPDEDDFEDDEDGYDEAVEKFEQAQEDLKEELQESVQRAVYDDVYDDLKDPIQYFVDDQGLYTKEQLFEQGFISLDEEAIIDDIISSDGWEHVLGDIEYIGDGKYVQWGSTGQIDMHNDFNMKKSVLKPEQMKLVKKAWKELHLKDIDTLTNEQKELANKVIEIFEGHKEFDTEQIGDYVEEDE